ncbi:MAG: hypothetical protein HYX27_25435 [Acidobacteria bacterium]|nr:hypothetical protein [Acidobacteriota bacterium]
MDKRRERLLMLAGAITTLFVATITVLLKVIPLPHGNLDYLVVGAVATFLSMILLWVAMVYGPKE